MGCTMYCKGWGAGFAWSVVFHGLVLYEVKSHYWLYERPIIIIMIHAVGIFSQGCSGGGIQTKRWFEGGGVSLFPTPSHT